MLQNVDRLQHFSELTHSGGLNKSLKTHIFDYLIPSWWNYLGRVGGVVLSREVVLRFQRTESTLSVLHCLLLASPDVSSQLFLLPGPAMMNSNPLTLEDQ